MKSTGVIRRVDELGRIVVPKEIRKKLGIGTDDPVEIYVDGEQIILKRYNECCIFCGNAQEIDSFMERPVCKTCIETLKRK
jgi:transcriptional pleiotropic regulator of transition state genes